SLPRMNTWPSAEAAPSSASKTPASRALARGEASAIRSVISGPPELAVGSFGTFTAWRRPRFQRSAVQGATGIPRGASDRIPDACDSPGVPPLRSTLHAPAAPGGPPNAGVERLRALLAAGDVTGFNQARPAGPLDLTGIVLEGVVLDGVRLD